MRREHMCRLAGKLCTTLVCALILGLLAGCGAKKALAPAESKEAMPGSTPPGGSMPATKGQHMGSKMVPGSGPVGGGTVGSEFGKGAARAGRGAKTGGD